MLSRLATTDGLDLVVQDVLGADKKPARKLAGKPTRAAFVKGADEKLTPLADYAAKNWAEHLPSARTSDAAARPTGTPTQRIEGPPRPRIAEQDGTPRLRAQCVLT